MGGARCSERFYGEEGREGERKKEEEEAGHSIFSFDLSVHVQGTHMCTHHT